MRLTRNATRAALLVAACLAGLPAAVVLGPSAALAVDTMTSTDAPDLASVRAKIKAKDFSAALAEL